MTGRAVALVVGLLLALGAVPGAGGPADDPPAGGLTALPASDGGGPNVVVNGGFERMADGALEGWGSKPDGERWRLANEAAEGARSLQLADPRRASRVPSIEQVVTLEPGQYTLEGAVRTKDMSAGDPRSGVRLCLDARPREQWWQCTDVARGTTDWTRLARRSIVVRERGSYRVWLGAYGAADGTAWFDDVSLREVGRRRLDVFLLHPNFRGLLFDDRSQVVRAAVGTSDVPAGARVRLQLVGEPDGDVAVTREYPATRAFTAELDAGRLPLGRYLLRAEVLDRDGAVVGRYPDHRVIKTSGQARARFAAWYDERNVLHLQGKPAFALGIYTTSGYSTSRATYADGRDGWGIARLAEAPLNLLVNYHLGQAPIPALTTYLDELHSRGIHYLQTVNFYHREDSQYGTIGYPAAREGDAALNRWVARTLGAHPGLAGFYTMDERPAEQVPRVFRQRQQLAAAAPGTVTYGVAGNGLEHQVALWRDALDVVGLDPYPITRPRGQNDLAMVGEWTRLGVDAVHGARPVWMVIQYFPLTGAGGWPTEAELRAMSWMAIVEGARGLFYWSFGAKGLAWVKDSREREQRWQELVRVTREIKALEPVLLAPDADVVAPAPGEGPVRWLGKVGPDGARYLFAYNGSGAPAAVTWRLASPATRVDDLDRGQPGPRIADGTIQDRLGPYEIRRYRIR